MARVRFATPSDVPALLEIGAEFHAASPYAELPFSRDELEDTLHMWLHRSDVGLFVAVDGDSVVGVAGVSWTPMFFGRATRYANELFWYVKPDQRRKGTGVLLRESIEGWAALQGCAFIYLTTFDDVPPDGYERQQTLFVRRLG